MSTSTAASLTDTLADPRLVADVPMFDPGRDTQPLAVPGWDPSFDQRAAIRTRVAAAGFALLDAGQSPTEKDLLTLAGRLQLGDPFVPPLYRLPGNVQVAASGVSVLRATHRVDAPAHPATATIGQAWHVDGTLQPLGEVRTTLLLCVRPAAAGGQSTLFNATSAFLEVADRDRSAAAALLTPGVLVRIASVNGCADTTAGPAFGVVDGRLLTRYARTETDQWRPEPGQEAALRRALAVLDELAGDGSPYRLDFTMTGGQGIVLANTRLCHGRTPYTDGPKPRTLLRALFTTDLVPVAR